MVCKICGSEDFEKKEGHFFCKDCGLKVSNEEVKYKIVEFGNYWQGKYKEDGKQPIEWLVLDIKGEIKLILSKYIIDIKKYEDDHFCSAIWESSQLRKWLNNEFINECFLNDEIEKIQLTNIEPEHSYESKEIKDRVFLLSEKEVEKYINIEKDRKGIVTIFSKEKGCFIGEEKVGLWWLRSADDYGHPLVVLNNGVISSAAIDADIGVRPAMWVKLKGGREYYGM